MGKNVNQIYQIQMINNHKKLFKFTNNQANTSYKDINFLPIQ